MKKVIISELKDDIEYSLSQPLFDFYDHLHNFRSRVHYDKQIILRMHPVMRRTIIFAQFFSIDIKSDPDLAKELFTLAEKKKKELGK